MDKHPLSTARGIAVGVTLGALAWGLLIGGSVAAFAQEAPLCGDFTSIRKTFSEKLHMVEVAGGIVNDKTVVVILASPDGKWASFALDPTGLACLGTRGEGWFQVRIPAPGERPA